MFSDQSLDDVTEVYDTDVLVHGSDYAPDGKDNLGYFRTFNSMPDGKDMDGNCKNA